MILESIEKRKSKIILKFNNSDTLEIYYDVYLMLSLFKGDEVTSEKVEKILNMNAEYEIKNSAFRYLSNRNHSTFELKRKLRKKDFDPEIIDRVISELLEKKYLDDFNFAENFVRNRIERRKEGIIKITSELYKKGVSREIISNVIEAVKELPVNSQNAFEVGKVKLEKIYKRGESDKNKIKSKLFNFLKGRGFTNDIIFEVMNKLIIE